MKPSTSALGSLVGYTIAGDSWLEASPDRNHWRVSLASQSKELVEDFADVLRKAGFDGKGGAPEPKVHYNETKNVWQVNLASKELYDWIHELTRDEVRRIAFKYPREFVRAAYDSNGGIGEVRPGRLSVRYGVSAKWLVDLFREILEKERGYRTTMWRSGDVWYVAVNNQDQVKDFLDWVDPIYKKPA